jgi:uncharacterized peroxidase-related enzyme
MSFLEIIPEETAPDAVAAIYAADRARMGYIPNYTRLFSLHPEAYQGWRGLVSSISRPMDERRYELATIGAARQLRSSYCSLAHGKILRDKFFDPSTVQQIVQNPGAAPLDGVDGAIVELAGKVADDATSVTEGDIEKLRSLGLSDRDIFDVVLAAAARCFFSKVLDATGTLPDRVYHDLEPELREALTLGRPIEEG